MLAASDSGLSCANCERRKPAMICMPLSCRRPLRLASRSILMRPALPSAAEAVMRTGLPKQVAADFKDAQAVDLADARRPRCRSAACHRRSFREFSFR